MNQKINVNEIIKENSLDESFSSVRKCLQIQLDLAKTSDLLNIQMQKKSTDKEIKNTIEIARNVRKKCLEFVFKFVNTDKKIINDLEQKDLYKLVNLICIEILGASKGDTKKQTPGEAVHSLENAIEDLNYEEQIAFTNFHILPDDFERQNFKQLQMILKANAPEDRIQDPIELLKSFGISPNSNV